jgi:hypothetical protein
MYKYEILEQYPSKSEIKRMEEEEDNYTRGPLFDGGGKVNLTILLPCIN